MILQRSFITFLGGAAAWPLAAAGQQQKPIIGWLDTQQPEGRLKGTINDGFRGWPRSAFWKAAT